jgi:hypothetical protein
MLPRPPAAPSSLPASSLNPPSILGKSAPFNSLASGRLNPEVNISDGWDGSKKLLAAPFYPQPFIAMLD